METSIARLKHPDLDASDLASQIRKATERTAIGDQMVAAVSDQPSPQTDLQINPAPDTDNAARQLSRLKFDTPTLSDDDNYEIKTLLQFSDEEFVQTAFRAILKREPDPAGHDYYLTSLRRGTLDKLDIIVDLRDSEEGKRNNVRLSGLSLPLLLRRMRSLPVVGYPLGLCLDVLRLPIIVQRLQRTIAINEARTQQIAHHTNQFQQQSENAVGNLLSSAKVAAKSLESLNAQYGEMQQRQAEMQRQQNEAQRQQHQLQQKISTVESEFHALLERSVREAAARVTALNEEIANLQRQTLRLGTSSDRSAKKLEETATHIQQLRRDLAIQGRHLARLAEMNQNFDKESKAKSRDLSAEGEHHLDALYTALEDRFRGSREAVKDLLAFYLPYVQKLPSPDLPIADLGCGRGEWLELLKEENVRALGVDTNRVALEICRERQLEVSETDVIGHLRKMPNDSLRAVTAFHLFEHLSPNNVVELLDEIARTVHPGGAVILETPNPDNLFVASNYFYFDPTHRHPLPSALLKFLIESRGFERVEVINLHPCAEGRFAGTDEVSARLNELFYGAMDYAVMGWKLDR